MKRSEMLDILELELKQVWGFDYNLTQRDLGIIIKILEKYDMLPPTTKDKDSYYSYNIANGKNPLSYCEWEPEDEKK